MARLNVRGGMPAVRTGALEELPLSKLRTAAGKASTPAPPAKQVEGQDADTEVDEPGEEYPFYPFTYFSYSDEVQSKVNTNLAARKFPTKARLVEYLETEEGLRMVRNLGGGD
eukprot:2680461-Pleurochrysis_carterae.AAC.2